MRYCMIAPDYRIINSILLQLQHKILVYASARVVSEATVEQLLGVKQGESPHAGTARLWYR